MTQKTKENPWTMDVRVRERNLKSGALTDKDVEKFLGGLPDVADQSEAFGTAQPALAQPVHVVHHVVHAPVESEPLGDEDDDEDEDDVDAAPEQGTSDGGDTGGEGVS